MNDPHIWWYITRASAIIAWVLMTLSVVWGILLSTRILRNSDNPGWLRDLHSYFSGLSLIMVGFHLVSLMLDGWLHFSITDVFVPFATNYRPLAVALGIIAFYLLVAVQFTSLIMKKLPQRLWRIIHFSSYGSLLLVSFHAGLSGTDVGSSWYSLLSIVMIVVAALAVVLRMVAGSRQAKSATAPTAATKIVASRKTMVIANVSRVADDVLGIRLVPLGGEPLDAWYPGAHITLHLANGVERQYSLCGDPAERHHYDIAVLKTLDSQGGSEWIHAFATPGMTIDVSGPLNHFQLEPAHDYLFIAGGIGITPIKAMIESLPSSRTWSLLYVGRSRASMAFLDELLARYPGHVLALPADELPGRPNLAAVIGASAAQVYCCGPEDLMMDVSDAVAADRMHLERFIPLVRLSERAVRSVDVTCTRSKKEFVVGPGQSILAAMEENGIPILGSCLKGICGTCEVRVTAGIPEHLDSVMDDSEKDLMHVMYPCVSRSQSDALVLDI